MKIQVDHFGSKKHFQKTNLLVIFETLYNILLKDKCLAIFFSFCAFCCWAYFRYKKVYLFQSFGCINLGQNQMWAIEAMQVTPGTADTHNNPHQRGAVPTAA